MHIGGIVVIYLYLSFAVHFVLPVLNNGSPKGSLAPFYSNMLRKRHDKVDINHSFSTKLVAIKLLIKQLHSEVLCCWKPFGNLAPFLKSE